MITNSEPIERFNVAPMPVDKWRYSLTLESIKDRRRLKMRRSEAINESNLELLDTLLKNFSEKEKNVLDFTPK